jgi:tRNA(Ile2) C34 agmatinyltransferase TiaS
MSIAARRKRARRTEAASKAAREREAAQFVLSVIDGHARTEVPGWMPAALAVWVQHATAEVFMHRGGLELAEAMEKARGVIAAMAEREADHG